VEPEIVGSVESTGADTVVPVTTAVGVELTLAVPPLFVAATTTRIVAPTSPAASAYDWAVAPLMPLQLLPEVSHLFHWYAYEVGVPAHVPVDAVKVWPCCDTPLICGSAVFDGADVGAGAGAGAGAVATTPVGAELALDDPLLLVAVTVTRSVLPTSADPSE
jgi:hypothetical protein